MEVVLKGYTEEEHIKGWETLRKCLENLKCEFSECIVENVHGYLESPRESDEESLYILLFSAPSNITYKEAQIEEIVVIDSKTFKLKEGQADYFFYDNPVPPAGYSIALDKNGRIIGYARGNTIWIPFDLIHEDFEPELFYYIVYQLFPYWKDYKEDTSSLQERFVFVYKSFIDAEADRVRQQIESSINQVSEAARRYQEAVRRHATLISVLEKSLETVEKLKDNAYAVLERIKSHNMVESFRLLPSGKVKVITKEIKLAGKYNIGRYAIYLGGDVIKVKRIGHTGGFPHHPHVDDNGNVCFGNLGKLTEAYSRGEWDVVVTGIIELLLSYNAGSPFIKLEQFLSQVNPEAYEELCRDAEGRKVMRIVRDEIIWD